jgi:hypothetical protein
MFSRSPRSTRATTKNGKSDRPRRERVNGPCKRRAISLCCLLMSHKHNRDADSHRVDSLTLSPARLFGRERLRPIAGAPHACIQHRRTCICPTTDARLRAASTQRTQRPGVLLRRHLTLTPLSLSQRLDRAQIEGSPRTLYTGVRSSPERGGGLGALGRLLLQHALVVGGHHL